MAEKKDDKKKGGNGEDRAARESDIGTEADKKEKKKQIGKCRKKTIK